MPTSFPACACLVLGGWTAAALSGSSTVFSDDITKRRGQERGHRGPRRLDPKLGNHSVTGGKVAAEALTGADLRG
jgi:hypothetical protein